MSPRPAPVDDIAARRKRAVRTALIAGAIAVLVYAAFLLSGMLAS